MRHQRGRGDLAPERIERSWTTWRGRAVEPVIRESLLGLLLDDSWPHTEAVGGWWNRQNNPETDLIGADREPVAGAVHFIGSVKWLESHLFADSSTSTACESRPVPKATPVRPAALGPGQDGTVGAGVTDAS